MKAAVLNKLGASPVYQDFPDPVPQNDEQIVIDVVAASVKNIDKARAGGKHYASYKEVPVVVGFDGIGVLENGTRIYAQGITGMIAERALISKGKFITLPDKIDTFMASALPNTALGAAMALRFRAKMQKGSNVLINGATGITGRVAVQLAKYYGARKVIVTGRNAASLDTLKQLGADDVVSLHQNDDTILKQLKEINNAYPIDTVIDYLWGHPAELVIKSLLGGTNQTHQPIRFVTVGEMAGEYINLSSGTLRSSFIEILGSGLGSFSPNELKTYNTEMLPELFQMAADKKITIETHVEKLTDIERVWNGDVGAGKRLVISIQ